MVLIEFESLLLLVNLDFIGSWNLNIENLIFYYLEEKLLFCIPAPSSDWPQKDIQYFHGGRYFKEENAYVA